MPDAHDKSPKERVDTAISLASELLLDNCIPALVVRSTKAYKLGVASGQRLSICFLYRVQSTDDGRLSQ